MAKLNIPIGISDFRKLRENGYYYIDKTGLVSKFLNTEPAEVTLITRPRRFGKTLGMSMLAHFFDIREDSKALFAGLEISRDSNACAKWMNQYPTIFLTFKRVDGLNFSNAYEMLVSVIAELYTEHRYLLDSDRVSEYDKRIFRNIVNGNASIIEIKNSMILLTRAMQDYYGKPVILLIDEYDVPVAKSNTNGYYNEMLDVMKGILQTLKDNPALCFGIISGCLKIAKESIFTGTNNFVSDTITSTRLDEYFGFTREDVTILLRDADAEEQADCIKSWYDGYRFGDVDVYCPWDVMNYIRDYQLNPKTKPTSYWKNTSDNAIIRSFIDYAGGSITIKLETLMSGGYIIQKIEEDLTYDYLHSSEENLWTILYLTGYLTRVPEKELSKSMRGTLYETGKSALIIPNAEIKEIFETTVIKWFDDNTRKWNRQKLFDAVWQGDSETLTQEMNTLLRKTISYHDYREDFYHAFLAGIFAGAGYVVESNREHGEGRSDVVVYDTANGRVAVFEAKYSKILENLNRDCETALQQIDDKMYAKEFEDNYDEILCYGISFFKKRCLVRG